MSNNQNDKKNQSGQLHIGSGVLVGWIGHFSAFCDACGISSDTERALLRSLKESGGTGYAEINNKQRFIKAEVGFEHLLKLAAQQIKD